VVGERVVSSVAVAPRRSVAHAVKEVLDRTLAGVLLLAALPVLLLAAVLIVVADRGPVLHRQTRVGRDGVAFRMWKLRTMRFTRTTRDAATPASAAKLRADPRVTTAGRLLRRLSVDELPQLVNVLGGSMSLVGPRPHLPEELHLDGDAARVRLRVKPGMTGLWQVSGRAELEWDEQLRLDVDYVERWSLGLDLRILVRTVPAVLSARGAY
jgi:lipopolysaccharide/colanic/teichoic acid biosynthesis glycosyltransferase